MQIADKGRAFEGWAGGRNYHTCSALFGMTAGFYKKGIGTLLLVEGEHALDLGCGTGALSLALAERSAPGARITGIDLSEDQLAFARSRATHRAKAEETGVPGQGTPVSLQFRQGSMDMLPFPDSSIDLVMSSMAMHEVPAKVRRSAIRETARVLKTGGEFLLIDWCQPRCTATGILWYLFVRRFGPRHDNWCNAYRGLAQARGLMLEEDSYISGFARRQLFRKVI